MKKIALLFILILLMGLFSSSCDKRESEAKEGKNENSVSVIEPSLLDTNSSDSSVPITPSEIASQKDHIEYFRSLILNSEYSNAIDYYTKNIKGNFRFESAAADTILELCSDLNANVLFGNTDKKNADIQLGVIDKVLEGVDLSIYGYEEVKAEIAGSLASKAAFSAGKELEELKNYADAIAEYNGVIDSDSNYHEAQAAIERCVATLKQDTFDKTKALIEKNEYIEAIAQLKALGEKLPKDNEIIEKITVYEKTYINHVIAAAAETFITPSTDYEKALDIINGALQHYSDNEELKEKKAYYQAFSPVYLYDMSKLKGEADTLDTDKDIYGNNYEKCFWSGYDSWMIWHKTDISYHLDKTYNTFTATVYSRSKKNDVQNMAVEIYADGKIVYQNLKIDDNATQPFIISLDVTGVAELRIVLTRNNGAIGAGIGMTDMIVQKTVK